MNICKLRSPFRRKNFFVNSRIQKRLFNGHSKIQALQPPMVTFIIWLVEHTVLNTYMTRETLVIKPETMLRPIFLLRINPVQVRDLILFIQIYFYYFRARKFSQWLVDIDYPQRLFELLPLKTSYLTFLIFWIMWWIHFMALFRKVLTSEKFLWHLKVKIHMVITVWPKILRSNQ